MCNKIFEETFQTLEIFKKKSEYENDMLLKHVSAPLKKLS